MDQQQRREDINYQSQKMKTGISLKTPQLLKEQQGNTVLNFILMNLTGWTKRTNILRHKLLKLSQEGTETLKDPVTIKVIRFTAKILLKRKLQDWIIS